MHLIAVIICVIVPQQLILCLLTQRGMNLLSPEGVYYRGFPRIGAYICDYEEARDLTCVYNQRCYHCDISQDKLGYNINGEIRNQSTMSMKVNNFSDVNHNNIKFI
jgi:hypothetical protein